MKITPPEAVRAQGEIVDRMKLAVKYLDQSTPQEIWNGFSTGMWGADYPGRTLEAYSRISLSLGEECTTRFEEVGSGLLSRQAPDGAFHIGHGNNDYEKGTGLWFGNARGLMGLLWAYRYKEDEKYLAAARRVGDYYLKHYFDKSQPGTPDHFWWVGTEALCTLYKECGEMKYLEMARRIAQTIPSVNFKSQHTHSYLLSIRGVAQIYEVSPEKSLLDLAISQQKIFREQIMWPGGGIVEHLGDRDNFTLNHWFDEGCSVCDWLGLNLDLWRITRDTEYLDMAERVAMNHLIFDQDEEGGFCGDRGVDFVREGSPWKFCCAMHGTRTLSEMTQYIATTDGKGIYINLFYPAKTELEVGGQKVSVIVETKYPKESPITLTLEPERSTKMDLCVRIPAWSRVLSLSVNDKKQTPKVKNGYLTLNRKWKPGDRVNIQLDLPLRTEKRTKYIGDTKDTDYNRVCLWKGPRLLVYNQELNNHLWKRKAIRPALRYVYQTYEKMELDQSAKGTPLRVGTKTYKKGLGVHSVSEIVYALGGEFKEFITDIGVDESGGAGGSVRFKVCVDGVVKERNAVRVGMGEQDMTEALYGFQVLTMTGRDEAKTLRINIENAQVLRLCVDEGVNGLASDYADWGDARLVRPDESVVYLSDLPNDRDLGLPLDWGTVVLREIKDDESSDTIVTLDYRLDDGNVPIRFNYLADLGYSLIKHRPVLATWVRADSDTRK